MREDGPFTAALAQTQDASAAIARALETIEADVRPSSQCGKGAVDRLEALLHARLLDGLKRGDVATDLDISHLSAFFANVVVSLVGETLSGGDPERLAAIRRVALRVLSGRAAVSA